MKNSMRCLFALELGGNYGHLVRCLPIAKRLREMGCDVLFSVNDNRTAHELLIPNDFEYVQSPRLRRAARPRSEINYSDILLCEGYADSNSLAGAVRGWLTLFNLYRPDVVIADHAPTAILSARIASIATAAIGNGFEIPPNISPLPSIQISKEITIQELLKTDERLLDSMNRVLHTHKNPTLNFVFELFKSTLRIFATFPELDCYGPRAGEIYSGVFYQMETGKKIEWKENPNESVKILAYVRPYVRGFGALLEALRELDHQTIFVAPGAHHEFVHRFSSENMRISNFPVLVEPLLKRANLAIGYGSMGFTTTALRAGVPQLLMPEFSEQKLSSEKVVEIGAGIRIQEERNNIIFLESINRLISGKSFYDASINFFKSYREYTASDKILSAVKKIGEIV